MKHRIRLDQIGFFDGTHSWYCTRCDMCGWIFTTKLQALKDSMHYRFFGKCRPTEGETP